MRGASSSSSDNFNPQSGNGHPQAGIAHARFSRDGRPMDPAGPDHRMMARELRRPPFAQEGRREDQPLFGMGDEDPRRQQRPQMTRRQQLMREREARHQQILQEREARHQQFLREREAHRQHREVPDGCRDPLLEMGEDNRPVQFASGLDIDRLDRRRRIQQEWAARRQERHAQHDDSNFDFMPGGMGFLGGLDGMNWESLGAPAACLEDVPASAFDITASGLAKEAENALQDERKCKENMSVFASNVIKAAASSQHPADGAAIDNVLLEVCKRVLSEKPNSECSDCMTEHPESLKRCHDSDKEENQERLESVCNSSPTLIPNRKVIKRNLGDKACDACVDASMNLSEEQKRTLEREGITGEWLARFRMIYNTMVRLQADGSKSSAAISALSTQAQKLAQEPEDSDEQERKRRRNTPRKIDPNACFPSKKRRED